MPSRFFIRAGEMPAYHPANHEGTSNRRLIGPAANGARQLEVVHGTLEPGRGALPHAHPGIEQVCYVLEGAAIAEVGGERRELGPGDCCYFPADAPHVFTATGERPAKILVIYSPPYEENPARVVRGGGR
jgi:mannose-6-phosphate isomerase-like protein (cupin superfamily)